MSARFLPYAATPGRALVQAACDLGVALWILLWILVGRAVHDLIDGFAEVGRRVQGGAGDIAGNLDSAGSRAGKVPIAGDALQTPLHAAGVAANNVAEAGAGLDAKATTLAIVLALAVSLPPILAIAVPWLFLRFRFGRRAAAAATLAASPGGQRLLALRALANRPMRRLTAISDDPVEAWNSGDRDTTARLAALELRSVGLR